jgi:3-deoxy-manno-octulosonate cytidylyltransferase (CMP-KDO synthetase)
VFKEEVLCVIPARLASTRFPRKLLQIINGKTILEMVYARAREAQSIDRTIVACDDEELKKCVELFGGQAVLTGKHHTSGTERLAEIAEHVGSGILVNVQGDEPMMHSDTIDRVVQALIRNPKCDVTTACVQKNDAEGFADPNVVKVIKDREGNALYFSRASIPYDRDAVSTAYFKHLGIYAYRRGFLSEFQNLSPSHLEQREKLEQLRALENGYKIHVIETIHDSIGIDTAQDFERVKSILTSQGREKVSHA